MQEDLNAIANFRDHLRHHLSGWKAKVEQDFSESAYDVEMAGLARDPVYAKFHLASPDYILIRLMGRMSISIGRRLGELYDKIPRIAAQAKYGLSREQVAKKFGILELDVGLEFAQIQSEANRRHLIEATQRNLGVDISKNAGVAIEVRYNFNPNDSSRIRKDEEMAGLIQANGFFPVYMVFAENSPRLEDAVARLRRAGWIFVIGEPALNYMAELVGFDISGVLDRPEISGEIKKEVDEMMAAIKASFAFTATSSAG